jgi:hypothetical protein
MSCHPWIVLVHPYRVGPYKYVFIFLAWVQTAVVNDMGPHLLAVSVWCGCVFYILQGTLWEREISNFWAHRTHTKLPHTFSLYTCPG